MWVTLVWLSTLVLSFFYVPLASALDNSTNRLIRSSDSGEDHRPAAAHDQLKIPKVVIVAGSAGWVCGFGLIGNHPCWFYQYRKELHDSQSPSEVALYVSTSRMYTIISTITSSWIVGTSQISECRFCSICSYGTNHSLIALPLLFKSSQLGCMSSVLRQLMVFHIDLQRFVDNLKERLGPQICNVPLLFQAVPELQDVLRQYNIDLNVLPQERLATRDLRTRFQFLVQHVFAVIAETRLFALFLDDLHDADESYAKFLCFRARHWSLTGPLSSSQPSSTRKVGWYIHFSDFDVFVLIVL